VDKKFGIAGIPRKMRHFTQWLCHFTHYFKTWRLRPLGKNIAPSAAIKYKAMPVHYFVLKAIYENKSILYDIV
jgi:hypothetical protein